VVFLFDRVFHIKNEKFVKFCALKKYSGTCRTWCHNIGGKNKDNTWPKWRHNTPDHKNKNRLLVSFLFLFFVFEFLSVLVHGERYPSLPGIIVGQ